MDARDWRVIVKAEDGTSVRAMSLAEYEAGGFVLKPGQSVGFEFQDSEGVWHLAPITSGMVSLEWAES